MVTERNIRVLYLVNVTQVEILLESYIEFPVTNYGDSEWGEGMLGFQPCFDSRAFSSTLLPDFIPKKVPWYSCTLYCKSIPELLIADRRIMSLENFQGPHRELNPGPLVVWPSASTNCTTACPLKLHIVMMIIFMIVNIRNVKAPLLPFPSHSFKFCIQTPHSRYDIV